MSSRIPSLAASLSFLLAAATLLAEPARIDRDDAELRADQGFTGTVLARPPAGASVEVLERQGAWARVKTASGVEGWTHEAFLEMEGPHAGGVPTKTERPPVDAATVVPAAPSSVGPEMTLRAEIARLEAELGVARLTTRTAEQSLMQSLERAERERDEALAGLKAAEERRPVESTPAPDVAEEIPIYEQIEAARREEREACEQRCAEEMAKVVNDALMDQLESGEFEDAVRGRIDAAVDEERSRAEAEELHRAGEVEARHAERERELEAASAQRMAALEDGHRRLFDTYVDEVTRRHEQALQRETRALAVEWEGRLVTERREHEKKLKAARRESGWEHEFDRAVREAVQARVDLEVGEAQARWEARQRGEQYDVERARREERARVEQECEAARLTAVSVALADARADADRRIAAVRGEADERCRLALELVLERAAAGEDMTKVRGMAQPSEASDERQAPPETKE